MSIKQEKFENPNQSIDYHIFTRDFCEKHNHEYHEIFIVLADKINYSINGKNVKLIEKTLSFVKKTDFHSFKGVNGNSATHINLYFSDELLKLVVASAASCCFSRTLSAMGFSFMCDSSKYTDCIQTAGIVPAFLYVFSTLYL